MSIIELQNEVVTERPQTNGRGATIEITIDAGGGEVEFYATSKKDKPSLYSDMQKIALDSDGNTSTTTDKILTFKGYPKWFAYRDVSGTNEVVYNGGVVGVSNHA